MPKKTLEEIIEDLEIKPSVLRDSPANSPKAVDFEPAANLQRSPTPTQ